MRRMICRTSALTLPRSTAKILSARTITGRMTCARPATASAKARRANGPRRAGDPRYQTRLPNPLPQAARPDLLGSGQVFVAESGEFTEGASERAEILRGRPLVLAENLQRHFLVGPLFQLAGGLQNPILEHGSDPSWHSALPPASIYQGGPISRNGEVGGRNGCPSLCFPVSVSALVTSP